MRTLILLCVSWALFAPRSYANPHAQMWLEGQPESFACPANGAQGGALYRQESGHLICLSNWESTYILDDGIGRSFRVVFSSARDESAEMKGHAFANAIGWVTRPDGYGSITDQVICPFEAPSTLVAMGPGQYLWHKPMFIYNDACCGLRQVRYTLELLTLVQQFP